MKKKENSVKRQKVTNHWHCCRVFGDDCVDARYCFVRLDDMVKRLYIDVRKSFLRILDDLKFNDVVSHPWGHIQLNGIVAHVVTTELPEVMRPSEDELDDEAVIMCPVAFNPYDLNETQLDIIWRTDCDGLKITGDGVYFTALAHYDDGYIETPDLSGALGV